MVGKNAAANVMIATTKVREFEQMLAAIFSRKAALENWLETLIQDD